MAADNKACALLTPAEIEAVVGGQKDGLHSVNTPGSESCTANLSANAGMMLSLTPKSGQKTSPSPLKAILDKLKQQGYQIETKTFESITCVSAISPKTLATAAVVTSCFVDKPASVASVQVIAKNQNGALSIDKLHPLAEKMVSAEAEPGPDRPAQRPSRRMNAHRKPQRQRRVVCRLERTGTGLSKETDRPCDSPQPVTFEDFEALLSGGCTNALVAVAASISTIF